MACHVPLYRALLELLRAIAVCPPLMPLLLPLDADDDSSVSISSLLEKMKQCVDTYASRLKYVCLSLFTCLLILCYLVLCEYSKFQIKSNSYFSIRFDSKRAQLFEIFKYESM